MTGRSISGRRCESSSNGGVPPWSKLSRSYVHRRDGFNETRFRRFWRFLKVNPPYSPRLTSIAGVVIMDHHVRCPKETLRICRCWDCQVARRRKKQKQWRERNPDYFIAHRILDRGKADRAPEPLRLPRPLSQLPWDIAQFEFGVKGTDFIGVLSTVLLRDAQFQFEVYLTDSARLSGTLPPARRNPRCRLWHRPGCLEPGHEAGVSPTRPPS
jgi:hypothetical protein